MAESQPLIGRAVSHCCILGKLGGGGMGVEETIRFGTSTLNLSLVHTERGNVVIQGHPLLGLVPLGAHTHRG